MSDCACSSRKGHDCDRKLSCAIGGFAKFQAGTETQERFPDYKPDQYKGV